MKKLEKLLFALIVILLLLGLAITKGDAIKQYLQTLRQNPENEVTTLSGGSERPTPISTDRYTVTEYAYGTTTLSKLDVYRPANVTQAPIIVMVHGGGWQVGDKASPRVVKNKVDFWAPQGYLFISVNYPMIPDGVTVAGQADALAEALIYIEKNVHLWGGDPNHMIVMGHSAGAHLVSLVSATRTNYPNLIPWAATILLDSAAYDVSAMMADSPTDIYTAAFGTDPAYWSAMSPLVQLTVPTEPTMIICSSKRAESVCAGASAYKDKLTALGVPATLYPVPLIHEDVNTQLGLPSDYTEAVDSFLQGLQ